MRGARIVCTSTTYSARFRHGKPERRNRAATRRATLADSGSGGPDQDPESRRGEVCRPVTIAYIAESAGVSIPTVSKVINGRSGVSADTRARVEELISRYGYRKPAGANRSNVLELVFRELEGMRAIEIIRGVERVARKHGVGV